MEILAGLAGHNCLPFSVFYYIVYSTFVKKHFHNNENFGMFGGS
jgi:hypothetical protein